MASPPTIEQIAAAVAIVGALVGLMRWLASRVKRFPAAGITWADVIVLALAIVVISTLTVYAVTRLPA